MKEIAALLINYGICFTFDHFGSQGSDISIQSSLNGFIAVENGEYVLDIESTNMTVPETESGLKQILSNLEELLIKETTGEE